MPQSSTALNTCLSGAMSVLDELPGAVAMSTVSRQRRLCAFLAFNFAFMVRRAAKMPRDYASDLTSCGSHVCWKLRCGCQSCWFCRLLQVVEFVHGYTNNSLGMLSDAAHMLLDNAAVVIGLVAEHYAVKCSTNGSCSDPMRWDRTKCIQIVL